MVAWSGSSVCLVDGWGWEGEKKGAAAVSPRSSPEAVTRHAAGAVQTPSIRETPNFVLAQSRPVRLDWVVAARDGTPHEGR